MRILPAMLGPLKTATRALLLRRLARDLAGLRAELATQNQILTRLADHFCPATPALDRDARADTGLSYLDPVDAGLALDYIAKIEAATGHVPSEDEILIYLADEKTRDLHVRLEEREQQLARLAAEREAAR